MKWYAIRPTPIGLHRVSGTNQLRIERELIDAGIEHYQPCETRFLKHHRTKEWQEKRYALMPYCFVATDAIMDWPRMERLVKDSFGPIRVNHVPMTIPAYQIEQVRAAQLQIDTAHALSHRNQSLTRRRLEELYPAGTPVTIAAGHMLAAQQATVIGATGRQTVLAICNMLGGQVKVELSVDDIQEAAE